MFWFLRNTAHIHQTFSCDNFSFYLRCGVPSLLSKVWDLGPCPPGTVLTWSLNQVLEVIQLQQASLQDNQLASNTLKHGTHIGIIARNWERQCVKLDNGLVTTTNHEFYNKNEGERHGWLDGGNSLTGVDMLWLTNMRLSPNNNTLVI